MSKTNFGVFLKQYRLDHQLSQVKLQQQLETSDARISSGYVSKIESGAIANPDDLFLAKVADLTGMTVPALRAMCGPASSISSTLKMACGYSVWNAPLFLAASEGLIPNLQVSSFVRGGSRDHIAAEHLDWIAPFSDQKEGAGRPELAPLSAADVASLLQRGEVDIGSLPGNLVRTPRLEAILLCVATIVDSASGCCFVCPQDIPDKSISMGNLSTENFGQLLAANLKKARTKKRSIRVGAEEGTIAFEYLSQACVHGGPDGSLPRHDIVWNCKSAELQNRSFRQLKETCKQEEEAELIGVVSWEPLASALMRHSRQDNSQALKKRALHFAPQEDSGKESHLTYEIVIPRRRLGDPVPRKRELFQTLNQLVTAVAETASRLNRITGEPESVIRKLAGFYSLVGEEGDGQEAIGPLEETQKIINGVLYSVRWHVLPEMGIGPQA